MGDLETVAVDPGGDEVLVAMLHQRRRRDLGNFRGRAAWIENSGPGGASRLVELVGGQVGALHDRLPSPTSNLYGYSAPAWTSAGDGRIFALLGPRAAGLLDPRDGSVEAVPLGPGQSAGYPRSVGPGRVVVVVDHGPGRGRSLQLVGPGRARRLIYWTADFIGDLAVDPTGRELAWVQWSPSTVPWMAATLMRGRLSGSVVEVDSVPGGDAAQPGFVDGAWVVDWRPTDPSPGEWFRPARLVDANPVDVGSVPAEHRPDWTFGRSWRATTRAGLLVGWARDSRAGFTLLTSDGPRDVPGGPDYLYEMVEVDGGAVAIGSTERVTSALFVTLDDGGGWRALEDEPARVSGPATLRRTPSGVPYLWWASGNDRAGVVLAVHAGPAAYTSFEFSWMRELWRAAGLSVAGVDYRGSTSYGRRHCEALLGHWGEFDVADVLDVAADVLERGEADPARVFVRGSSAGGLTALLCGLDPRISGVVAVSPVTDLAQEVASAPELERAASRALVGADPGDPVYARRSPLERVAEMRARVLLIHGVDDAIVPVERSRELARRLGDAGRTVRLLEIAGEGHSLRGADALRASYAAEMAHYGTPVAWA